MSGPVMPVVLVVPVVVEGWQHGCCGDTVAVGARVSWRLRLLPSTWAAAAIDLPVSVEPVTSTVLEEWRSATEPEEGEPPVLARASGLVVFVADRALLVGDRAGGALYEDRHTGVPWSVPGTTGTVERVRLVTRGHRRVGRRELVPVHGTEELTDVDLAPRHLPDHPEPGGVELWPQTSELLVDLRVDPEDPVRV